MILIITFVTCMFLGVPIMATIGMATLVPLLVDDTIPLTLIPQVLYTGTDQFPLIAVASFILAGALMEAAKLTDKIIDVARELLGSVTGGLAAVTILACAIFASLSGSGPATAAAVGALAIPMMTRYNYGKNFSAGVSAAGGALGILIPPSNPMIIYAVTANVSVTKMFMAGFVPGALVTVALMITAVIVSKRRGYMGTGEKFSIAKVVKAVWVGRWALLSPFIILGGIYGGVFTPTEAAEVAVIYAVFVGTVIYKTLTLKKIYNALVESAMMTGTIVIIVGISVAFGRLLALYQIPDMVTASILSVSNDPTIVLLLITALLLFVGMWMETLSQIIILTPVFLPLIRSLGIDPIHFGIFFVLLCEIGFLTPPLGANLFVVTKLANVSIEDVTKGVMPFVVAYLVCVLFIIFVPQISLWLPNMLK